MAHPHRAAVLYAVQERLFFLNDQAGHAILPFCRLLHPAAKKLDRELETIANAQDGYIQREDAKVADRSISIVDAFRPAGQDNPLGVSGCDIIQRCTKREYFTVYAKLPYFACNELGILRAEIEYYDDFLVIIHHGLLEPVIRRLFCYDNIMNMAFPQRCRGYSYEFSLLPEFLQI